MLQAMARIVSGRLEVRVALAAKCSWGPKMTGMQDRDVYENRAFLSASSCTVGSTNSDIAVCGSPPATPISSPMSSFVPIPRNFSPELVHLAFDPCDHVERYNSNFRTEQPLSNPVQDDLERFESPTARPHTLALDAAHLSLKSRWISITNPGFAVHNSLWSLRPS